MFKRLLHIKIRGSIKSKINFVKVPKIKAEDVQEKVARGKKHLWRRDTL